MMDWLHRMLFGAPTPTPAPGNGQRFRVVEVDGAFYVERDPLGVHCVDRPLRGSWLRLAKDGAYRGFLVDGAWTDPVAFSEAVRAFSTLADAQEALYRASGRVEALANVKTWIDFTT